MLNEPLFHADKILHSITTAIIVLDERLNIAFTNNAACQLIGQSEKRLAKQPFHCLFHHFSLPLETITHAMAQQTDFNDSEIHAILADSRPVLLTLNCSVLNQNDHSYALLELRQIDQQKRIVQENQHENQHLAARGLVRGLAHEIKNPLGGIKGAAQLLQKQLPSEDLKAYTTMVIEQSDRLRDLVDRLLGPNKPPSWQQSNIHEVLDKTLKLITFEHGEATDDSVASPVQIKRDYDPSIPDIAIDPQLIQQALLNIMLNGVQAMNSHDQSAILTVCTRIKHHPTINGRRYRIGLEIKVIDNGPGVPTELMDTLFFPLVTGKTNGTGLGLSISQTLIHQHDGRIECDSWPGHTQFSLLIPFRETS